MAIEGLLSSNDEHFNQDEEPNATTYKNDMDCKIVHLVDACVGVTKLLGFHHRRRFRKFFLFRVVASGVHL